MYKGIGQTGTHLARVRNRKKAGVAGGSKETGSAREEKLASREAGSNLLSVSKVKKRVFLGQSNQWV